MSVHYRDDSVTLLHGNALTLAGTLEADSVQTIVTSPPYFGLRDYGTDEQFGTEDTLDEYVQNLVGLFAALRPALRNDGTVWINLGDSYAGRANDGPSYRGNHQSFKKEGRVPGRKSTTAAAPFKNLLGVPWRVAFGLQADGWILRSDVIWSKPNPMPESVTDRPTKSHEYLFLLAKSPRYYFDADAIAEDVERPADPGTRVGGVKYGDSAAGENRAEKAQSSKGNADHIVDEGPKQSLANFGISLAGNVDGVGDETRIASHEGNAGRMYGHIRTGRHCYADVGCSQSRSVVHAVSNHGDGAVSCLESCHGLGLSFRQNVRYHLIDAQLLSDCVSAALIVARQHSDPNASAMQRVDGSLC